ncbi:Uncharacterised protein [Vibrio cholerae]|nr:Uncharacterised protein [Vibrio cholerae]CSB63225.1 Uncharacterised protein [Vibrio cholerae]
MSTKTARTADALFILFALLIFFCDRQTASITDLIITFGKAMPYRNAPIKHIAIPFPQALLLRHFFKIFQDAAFKVIHLFKALLFQICGGFFTADPASTEHGDFLVLLRIKVFLYIVWKLAERLRFWVERVFKGAKLYFVVVSGIHHQDFRIGNQRVPILRLHISAHYMTGIYAFYAHGHDLFFEFDLSAVKRWLRGRRLFIHSAF